MAEPTTIFAQVGGSGKVHALAHAWHARCLADPIASHPFSHPGLHPQHTERLAAYWIEAFGGPPVYSTQMGDHSTMLAIHAGNGEHHELDEICVACFSQALADVDIPHHLRPVLREWFAEATAETALYPEGPRRIPRGLEIPVLAPPAA